MSKLFGYILAGLLALSIVTNLVNCGGKHKAQSQADALRDFLFVSNDTLVKTTDAAGRLIAKARVLQLENWKLLDEVENRDTVIADMLTIIKEQERRLKSVTAFTTETSVTKTLPTAIILRDTVVEYVAKYEDKWLKMNTAANADSTRFKVQLRNDFYAWSKFGRRKSLFGDRTLDVFVRSENPYTDIERVEQFTVEQPKPRRIGVGIYAGYGVTAEMKLQPSIGVGVFYKILR